MLIEDIKRKYTGYMWETRGRHIVKVLTNIYLSEIQERYSKTKIPNKVDDIQKLKLEIIKDYQRYFSDWKEKIKQDSFYQNVTLEIKKRIKTKR